MSWPLPIEVPAALAASQSKHGGASGRAWIAGLPQLAASFLDRWATGDVTRAVRRRFDQLTDVLGLDRPGAAAWTLGRVLQESLWDIEDDDQTTLDPAQIVIATALLGCQPQYR
jgi:hypothetical protein